MIRKINPNLLFILLLVLVSLYFNYHKTINQPPKGYHFWRQTDGSSQVINYMKNGLNFFDFGTLSYSSNKYATNDAVSEFPIFYYIAAIFNTVFGYNYFTLRFIHFIIFFIGLFYLFKASQTQLKNNFLSILVSLFTFSIIPLAFYGNTSLPDIPALGLFFIGFYAFIKAEQTQNQNWLIASLFFLSFSALIRITFYYGIASISLFYILHHLGVFFKTKNKLIPHKKTIFLGIIFLIIPLAWVLVAIFYNKLSETGIFLTKIAPIWKADNLRYYFFEIFSNNLQRVIYFWTSILTVFFMFLSILFYKSINKSLLYFLIIFSLSSLSYFLLWFTQFLPHNYYFIEMSPWFAILFISVFSILKQHLTKTQFKLSLAFFSLLLLYNIYYTHFEIRNIYRPMIGETQKLECLYSDLYTIRPYLDSIGIKKDDKVISDFDYTPNYSLFIMQRYGLGKKHLKWVSLDFLKTKGIKYLICNKKAINPKTKAYKNNLIGTWGNIEIYKLEIQ